jgi:glutathione S-transferase
MLDALQSFETAFVGPFIAGELSIADFTMFPFLRMLERIEDHKPRLGIPDDGPAAEVARLEGRHREAALLREDDPAA